MSHIHIPDGVLPFWIVAAGWVLTVVLMMLAARSVSGRDLTDKLPLLGVMSATMIVLMMLEIVPIAYHVNLSVITGIILGPALGFIAAFIVNVILALVGHGGVTVIGLNTLVVGTETVVGYYLFHAATRALGNRLGIGLIAALVTLVTLLTSSAVMIGIVGISNVNPAEQAPLGAIVEPEALSFRNPFGGQILVFELFPRAEQRPTTVDLATFARLVLFLGMFGWTLEAVLTGLIARYLQQVRPDLLAAKG